MENNSEILSKNENQSAGGKNAAEQTFTSEQAKGINNEVANASFGKFESGEALLNAYNSLEAEFTKRSQQLRQLQRENEELKEQATSVNRKCEFDPGAESHAVQYETESAAKERAGDDASLSDVKGDEFIAAEVANFLRENPEAASLAEEIALKSSELGNVERGFLQRAYTAVLRDILHAEQAKVNDEFIYQKALSTPAVKEKLIRDYLAEVAKGKKVTLISQVGESALTPPKKPHTILEAGEMAAKVLKKGKVSPLG
ncbi:MAG: hypothetical protein IJW13_00855 [Clostridia bacterium]|nr:hypothetical protein [Clostridia bacterium]